MRFKIINDKPYLVWNDNKLYKVRWNDEGFTVGTEYVPEKSDIIPEETQGELGIRAKCSILDSITEEVVKKRATRSKKTKE